MNRNQRGFSHIVIIGALFVLIIIGFAVWNITNKKDTITTNQNKSSETKAEDAKTTEAAKNSEENKKDAAVTAPASLGKDYKNTTIELSFSYPNDWVLKESISNFRGLGDEGHISVTSPSGLRLYLTAGYGGKGGDCIPDAADTPHSTKNCHTLEVLYKEKVPVYATTEDTYFFRFKYTESKVNGVAPPSVYGLFLTNGDEAEYTTGQTMGALSDHGIIYNPKSKPVYLTTFITGGNTTSEAFFSSADGKMAEAILKTVRRN